jgi:hypothetical protein
MKRETIAQLRTERAALQLKVDELAAIVSKDDGLLRATIDARGVDAQVRVGFLRLVCGEVRQTLIDNQAVNYVEMQMHDDHGFLLVTIQKLEKPTPHQLRQLAELQCEQLREALRKFDPAHPALAPIEPCVQAGPADTADGFRVGADLTQKPRKKRQNASQCSQQSKEKP